MAKMLRSAEQNQGSLGVLHCQYGESGLIEGKGHNYLTRLEREVLVVGPCTSGGTELHNRGRMATA